MWHDHLKQWNIWNTSKVRGEWQKEGGKRTKGGKADRLCVKKTDLMASGPWKHMSGFEIARVANMHIH